MDALKNLGITIDNHFTNKMADFTEFYPRLIKTTGPNRTPGIDFATVFQNKSHCGLFEP